jgi:hypothetical protein
MVWFFSYSGENMRNVIKKAGSIPIICTYTGSFDDSSTELIDDYRLTSFKIFMLVDGEWTHDPSYTYNIAFLSDVSEKDIHCAIERLIDYSYDRIVESCEEEHHMCS